MKRKTKRFFASLLTAMMFCSFIPTAAMAETFTDQDNIDEAEAVEVMVSLDVSEGSKDVLVPEGTFTQDQAAKLIIALKNGNTPVVIREASMSSLDSDQNFTGREYTGGQWMFYVTEPGTYGGRFHYEGSTPEGLWIEMNIGESGSVASASDSDRSVMHHVNIQNALGENIYDQRVASRFELDKAAIQALAMEGVEPGDSPLGWWDNNGKLLIGFDDLDLTVTSDCSYTLATASNTSNVEDRTDENGSAVTGITNYNGSTLEYTQNMQTNDIQETITLTSGDMIQAAGSVSATATVAQITVSTQADETVMPAFQNQLNQVVFNANASDLNKIAQANKSLRIVTDAGTWQLDNTALETLYKAEKQTANGEVSNPDGLVQFIAKKTPATGWSIELQKVVNGEARAVVNKDVLYNLSFTEAAPATGTLQKDGLRGFVSIDQDVNDQNVATTVLRSDLAAEMTAQTKNNILIQSAQAMLDAANALPQGVLQLMQ